jgi:hypothetical protein
MVRTYLGMQVLNASTSAGVLGFVKRGRSFVSLVR